MNKPIEDVKEILFTKDQIATKVQEIASKINNDYNSDNLVMVCILRGSCYFYTDLTRLIDKQCFLEFMSVSSYKGTVSSGEVKINRDIGMPIEGKDVIIVEDIIDTGTTLSFLKKILAQRNPKSIKICALLDKPSRRKVEIKGDYIGFEIPDKFVVGYGLDYNQLYRNLPDIGVLKEEIYTKNE